MEGDINSYPLLGANDNLNRVFRNIENNGKRAFNLIEGIQNICQHFCSQKNFIEDYGYVWGFKDNDKHILDSKTCVRCGYTKSRPRGAPWEICHKCWGKMKLQEAFVPPHGGDMICTYKCKKCGHTVYGEVINKKTNGESD